MFEHEINGAHASRSTRVALAKRANNHYGDHCGVAPPRLNEVEQELIKYASAARPLRGLRILLEGDAPPSTHVAAEAAHAERPSMESGGGTLKHEEGVRESTRRTEELEEVTNHRLLIDGVAVWCCSYHADDEGHPRDETESLHMCVELFGRSHNSHWYSFGVNLLPGQLLCEKHSLFHDIKHCVGLLLASGESVTTNTESPTPGQKGKTEMIWPKKGCVLSIDSY